MKSNRRSKRPNFEICYTVEYERGKEKREKFLKKQWLGNFFFCRCLRLFCTLSTIFYIFLFVYPLQQFLGFPYYHENIMNGFYRIKLVLHQILKPFRRFGTLVHQPLVMMQIRVRFNVEDNIIQHLPNFSFLFAVLNSNL